MGVANFPSNAVCNPDVLAMLKAASAIAVVIAVVPEPVTIPVSVMVWLPEILAFICPCNFSKATSNESVSNTVEFAPVTKPLTI